MKKFNYRKRQILINHANKEFKLRVRFKKMKTKKNRLLQGCNFEQKKLHRLNDHFKDYKKIKAPEVFSLIENTEQTLGFIKSLESALDGRKKVFVNLKDVKSIAHGAIVVLLSIMTKFKSSGVDFNGNFPDSLEVKKILLDSGFFNELYKNNVVLNSKYAVCKKQIFTHANKIVDSKLADEIISEISTMIWGEKRRCKGLQRIFIELMQNTNNHASLINKGEHYWWTTVRYDKQQNKAYFSFIDYGVGIIQSLNNDKNGKFYNILPKIKSIFAPESNAELLMLLLKGEIHNQKKTSTNQYYRGKGLPCLFKACEDNKISNVVVITNDAKAEYANKQCYKLKNSFSGTFLHWELNINNQNIKY